MTLTPEEIATLVTVFAVFLAALAQYLTHLSTAAKVDALHVKLDALGTAAVTPAPTVVLVDGHNTGPSTPAPNAFTASMMRPRAPGYAVQGGSTGVPTTGGAVTIPAPVTRPGDPT